MSSTTLILRAGWHWPALGWPTLRLEALTLLASLFFLLLCNGPFWRRAYAVAPPDAPAQLAGLSRGLPAVDAGAQPVAYGAGVALGTYCGRY